MKTDPRTLSKFVQVSLDKVQHLHRARTQLMVGTAGRFFASKEVGEDKAAPLALLYQTVTSLVPNLVFNNPKFRVRSQLTDFRDYADMLGLAVDKTIEATNARDELRKIVTDSLFMAGFAKVGMADSGARITLPDGDYPLGQPMLMRVDPTDMILDTAARSWHEQSVYGNRFRVHRDRLQEHLPGVDEEVIKKLPRSGSTNRKNPSDLLGDIPQGSGVYDFVELAELYIPAENRLVTLPLGPDGKSATAEFLRDVEWYGPDSGPYRMLGYTWLGDTMLPVPPLGVLFDLQTMINRIARKIVRQSDRIKRVLAYEGEAFEDASRISEADDGEAVQVNNIDRIREIQYGGASDDTFNFVAWARNWFNDLGMNTDLLAGTSTGEPTATQAQLVQANSTVRLSDMQGQVHQFVSGIGSDIGWYLHHDPLIELPLIRRRSGREEQLIFSPSEREGDFYDYQFEVEPFSLARKDPNQKVRQMLNAATAVIPAAAQAAQILGPGFRADQFLNRIFREIGLEDMDEYFDGEAFQKWIQLQMMAQGQVDPGKAEGTDLPGALMQPPNMQDFNPAQPNPGAMGQTRPRDPQQQQAQEGANQAQQEQRADIPPDIASLLPGQLGQT